MKQNSSLTSFLVFAIAIILLTITSLLMSSCTGIRYTYYNKQKAPYTAKEETKTAQTIPVKPFLNQAENEPKEKISSVLEQQDKKKGAAQNNAVEQKAPVKLGQIFNEKNIAKYLPKQGQGIQSESQNQMDRDTTIVILVIAILVIIALTGDLLGLLFLALLVLLVYILIKYLGVFN